MPELNNCEKIELWADEYFHGELSPKDNKIMDEHIINCEKCAEFFENEKIYFDEIKLAEYIPEINIAESVMDKIISGRITVDKPAKKKFIPFGLISAAVIVLVMLVASRDNLYLINSNIASDENADMPENIMIYEAAGEFMMASDADYGEASPEMRMEQAEEYDSIYEDNEPEAFRLDTATDDNWTVPFGEEVASGGGSAAPAAEQVAAVTGVSNIGDITAGEIIKIKRGLEEDFIFSETVRENILESASGGWFAISENKNILIEDLEKHNIYYEIENTGIESEYLQIVYID